MELESSQIRLQAACAMQQVYWKELDACLPAMNLFRH